MSRPARLAMCASRRRATRCARRSRASIWMGPVGASSPGASATRWVSRFTPPPASFGRTTTIATTWATTSPRASEHSQGRPVVRLAAVLPAEPAQPRVSGGRLLGGRAAGADGAGALGAPRARVLYGRHVSRRLRRRCVHDVSRLLESLRTHGCEGRPGACAERPAGLSRRLRHGVAAGERNALGTTGWATGDAGWSAAGERRRGRSDLEGELWTLGQWRLVEVGGGW